MFQSLLSKCIRLFSSYNFLNVVQLVQSFKWGKVVHIKIQNFITHLTKNRVVQLEETKLHSIPI